MINKAELFFNNIQQNYNLHSAVLHDHILSNISIGLTRTDKMKNDINKLYELDKFKYYNAVINSNCINHLIVLQGSLEQEVYARKVLGILLVAENDSSLRSKVISLLRKYYPLVYRSVKKYTDKELLNKYLAMDELTMRTERRLESAVYIYFVIYCSTLKIDEHFLFSIINDIKNYEYSSPMTIDIHKELESHKTEIEKIKEYIKTEYGEINKYADLINVQNENIYDTDCIIENLFMINKIDINQIFNNSKTINIDYILLAYIKVGYKGIEPNIIIPALVSGIFIQLLIDEYKKSKKLYFENNEETAFFTINSLEEKVSELENENTTLNSKLESLNEQKSKFDDTLNSQINKLVKTHEAETLALKKTIEKLEKQLEEEKTYKNELNMLREYMFQTKNDYVPNNTISSLSDFIFNKQIIIIGGTKEWRRKFKEKYPEITTLTGFNDKLDVNILSNADYIFFYTGMMSHSTYYKAINYIRLNQLKFGYIGKTNMDLVEEELIEELQKCSFEATPSPEELSPGHYYINLKRVIENNEKISSKQVLMPFLSNTTFTELEIDCSHVPPWFKIQFNNFNLNSTVESLIDGSFKVKVYPKTSV